MKFCIVALFFIAAAVHGVSETDPLACIDQFDNDATELSNHVSPEISENLQKTIKLFTNAKPCISSGDVECTALTLFGDLVSNTNKSIQQSTGDQRTLFLKFVALESLAIQNIQSQPNATAQDLITTICTVCNGTSNLIEKYLIQSPETPST